MAKSSCKQHAGGEQVSPELEAQKSTRKFACSPGFHRVLFLCTNPSGRYQKSMGEKGNTVSSKKENRVANGTRLIVCFLRAQWGA